MGLKEDIEKRVRAIRANLREIDFNIEKISKKVRIEDWKKISQEIDAINTASTVIQSELS